jgi:hypothetical protein
MNADAVTVHPRVHERHPEIEEADALDAWGNCIRSVPRIAKNPNEHIAVGVDRKGRLIELIAIWSPADGWLIFHALTPPTKKSLAELQIIRRH